MNEEIKKEAQDIELNLEELGEVAGGYIFGRGDDRNRPWEVINLDGSVVERFATKEEAINLANIIGLGVKELSYKELEEIRRRCGQI